MNIQFLFFLWTKSLGSFPNKSRATVLGLRNRFLPSGALNLIDATIDLDGRSRGRDASFYKEVAPLIDS